MKLLDIARQFVESFTSPWWVEITTATPKCMYYFGEFTNKLEARSAVPGYVEDLNGEGAQGIKVVLKRCNPKELTVCVKDE